MKSYTHNQYVDLKCSGFVHPDVTDGWSFQASSSESIPLKGRPVQGCPHPPESLSSSLTRLHLIIVVLAWWLLTWGVAKQIQTPKNNNDCSLQGWKKKSSCKYLKRDIILLARYSLIRTLLLFYAEFSLWMNVLLVKPLLFNPFARKTKYVKISKL